MNIYFETRTDEEDPMNKGRWIIASLAVFVVFFALEMLIHGFCLRGIYQQLASVWRPEADMKRLMGLMWVGYLFFAPVFALIYTKGYEKGKAGVGQGLRYGFLVALLIAVPSSLGWYVILPIPARLAADWILAGLVEYMAAGLTVGLIYRET